MSIHGTVQRAERLALSRDPYLRSKATVALRSVILRVWGQGSKSEVSLLGDPDRRRDERRSRVDWLSGQGLTYNNEQETLRWYAVEPFRNPINLA